MIAPTPMKIVAARSALAESAKATVAAWKECATAIAAQMVAHAANHAKTIAMPMTVAAIAATALAAALAVVCDGKKPKQDFSLKPKIAISATA